MKKILAFLILAAGFSNFAFAAAGGNVTVTITSRQRYEDKDGVAYERVLGTLAMDANYNCNATSKQCGYRFTPTMIGISNIRKLDIEPQLSTVVGQPAQGAVVLFKYHREGLVSNGVTGLETANIRAYYWGNSTANASGATISAGGLISTPSYDFSGLTAVPFEAVGPVI